MTVHSNINYDDQDDGHILKAARKQQYIMFPAPISFLNDELKAEIGMKTKKDDEEDDTKPPPLKVPIDPADKDYKTYILKIHKYNMGTAEELLKWWMTLMEQIKANGYGEKYDIVMNLAQATLHGCGLDAFVNVRRAQIAKNQIRVEKNQTELNEHQIHDYTIFELTIRAFDIQSGWRASLSISASTREETFSWEISTLINSVKDWKK
jgi:hypothetical protein